MVIACICAEPKPHVIAYSAPVVATSNSYFASGLHAPYVAAAAYPYLSAYSTPYVAAAPYSPYSSNVLL